MRIYSKQPERMLRSIRKLKRKLILGLERFTVKNVFKLVLKKIKTIWCKKKDNLMK